MVKLVWNSSSLKSSIMSLMDSEKVKCVFAQVFPLFGLYCGNNFVSFERNLWMEAESLIDVPGEATWLSGDLSSVSAQ